MIIIITISFLLSLSQWTVPLQLELHSSYLAQSPAIPSSARCFISIISSYLTQSVSVNPLTSIKSKKACCRYQWDNDSIWKILKDTQPGKASLGNRLIDFYSYSYYKLLLNEIKRVSNWDLEMLVIGRFCHHWTLFLRVTQYFLLS